MSWHLKDEEELARWRGEGKASQAGGTARTRAQCKLRLDHRGKDTPREMGLRRRVGLSPREGFGIYSKDKSSLKSITQVK